MSSSAINAQLFQAKIGSIQNQADSSSVYSAGVWSFKNSTALPSVTITDAGNVGIGTASPVVALEIVRNSASTGGSDYPNIRINNQNATGYSGLYFYQGATLKAGLEVKNDVGALVFGNGAGFTERMRIDANGNVKIAPNSIQGATTKGFSLRSISTDGGTNSANVYCNSRYGSGKFVVLAAFDPNGNSVSATTPVGAGSTFIVLVTDAASNY